MSYFCNLGVRKDPTSIKETFDKFDRFENLNILYGKKKDILIKSKVKKKNQNIKTLLKLIYNTFDN